jgi:hypothetical protein
VRARQAIQATLTKYAQGASPPLQWQMSAFEVERNWARALVLVAAGDSADGAGMGTIELHVLARRLPDSEAWQALMPDVDGLYLDWLAAAPESLVPAAEKARLQAGADRLSGLWALSAGNRPAQAVPPRPSQVTLATSAEAEAVPVWGPEDARRAALARMQTQVDAGRAPAWAEAYLGDAIPLYDLSGEITAYLFPVAVDQTAAGYLTVAALPLPNPVLEFAVTGPTPLDGALSMIQGQGLRLKTPERPLYLGLLKYAYEWEAPPAGTRRVLDLRSGTTFEVSEEDARRPLRERIPLDDLQTQDQPIQAMAFSLIEGMPDWNQFWGSYGCYSGCAPTAGTNVVGYWDSHGYGNLIDGGNWQAAVDEMRNRMGTECTADGGGSTNVGNISPGINSYAGAHGYSFASEMWCNGCSVTPSYDRYRGQIDADRPLVVDVIGHSQYGNHSVAGVGYETNGSYMIIHDNWSSTAQDVYLHYGSGYSQIFLHPVTPGGGATCPSSGGVILYRHAGYDCGGLQENDGYVQETDPGGYDVGGLGINDQASSVRIPAGWSVKLYRDGGFGGPSACLNGDDEDFANNAYTGGGGLNDSVSSFRVYNSPDCGGSPGEGVNLCRNTGYSDCMLFSGDASSLGNAGFGNDDAESIQMLGDWSAVLFADDSYQGTRSVFDGSDSDLSNNAIGNDQASSMRVRRRVPAVFTLYDLGDWGGASFPSDRTIYDLGHWDFNDRAESIRVASGYQVVVCEHSDFHGACGRASGDAGDLNSLASGLRNAASSVRVCAGACPPAPGAPSLTSPADGAVFSPGSLVTFRWTGNGERYLLELWGGGLSSTQSSGWIEGSQWSRSGLATSANAYHWRVKAWNDYGESGWSGTWSFRISGAPAAPSNLAATSVSREQINLAWTDNSGDEDGFKIYRDGVYIGQVGANVTAYQDSGRQCGTSYAYTVRATNAAGDSAASNTASATTYACPAPVDLVPTQLSGWAYPIIPASVTGTDEVGELYNDRPTYLDWGVTNQGGADTDADVYGEVYVDSTRLGSYNFGRVLAYQAWYFEDWPSWTQHVPGWHTLKVVVDPEDLVAEADEGNNTWQGQFYWQPACDDAYEDNDTPAGATALAIGQTRDADICGPGDYDHYRFNGAAGQRIVVDIDAQVDGSRLDTYLSLIDGDGSTVLAEHDDEVLDVRLDSHLGYELPRDGSYYIRVRAFDHPNAGGPDHFYSIRLLQDNSLPVTEISLPSDGAWLDPDLATLLVSASDGESGISHVDFLWHDADWSDSDWTWLGGDWDGSDGWSWDFDTGSQPEQSGAAFCIWTFNWAGNWSGDCIWQLGIDRTPPLTSAGISLLYGDAPFRDFYVHWAGSDNLSGVASYDVQYRDGATGNWTDSLSGTASTRLRFTGQEDHTYYFRARARDAAGNLGDYAGTQHTVSICATSPDVYETDNGYEDARTIVTGDTQTHNFHAAGDQDWLRFSARAGVVYTLATANTGGHADTMLSLYAANGSSLLAFNDDDPDNWPASRLEWGADQGGTYYVKIEHWDPYAYGCTTDYEFSIIESGHFNPSVELFLPLILRNER